MDSVVGLMKRLFQKPDVIVLTMVVCNVSVRMLS